MKKTDRRTIYTKNAIKNSLLDVLQKKNFTDVTVTEVCRNAEINRGTFYLHYTNMTGVLNEIIDDVFQNAKSLFEHLNLDNYNPSSRCKTPFCQHIQNSGKSKVIFLDDTLTGYIIKKLYNYYKEDFIAQLTAISDLTEKQAYAIFIFQMNGCFAVNKAMHWNCPDNKEWCPVQETIDGFIQRGIQGFIGKNN